MNRRRFLAGLGAALATVAVTTRLGQSSLPKLAAPVGMDGDFDPSQMRYKVTERYSHAWADIRIIGTDIDGRIIDEVLHAPIRDTRVDPAAVAKTWKHITSIHT